jgi:Ser/Thr protein kinase RdoA (MazF antagonist)
MEYIDGENLFEKNHSLNEKEVKFIAHQAGLINSTKLKPFQVYDSWAIINFLKEFKEKSKFLSEKDLDLVKPLVNKFKDLKIETLPHCFVHGDMIKTNVIKDSKGKLWILDFSVSNYYPRIQELAVLACNLFFDENNKEKSDKNLKIALEEYQKIIKLTDKELNSLNTYIELAHAMHLLCANEEKINKNNNSEENEYWLGQGRKGLQQSY